MQVLWLGVFAFEQPRPANLVLDGPDTRIRALIEARPDKTTMHILTKTSKV